LLAGLDYANIAVLDCIAAECRRLGSRAVAKEGLDEAAVGDSSASIKCWRRPPPAYGKKGLKTKPFATASSSRMVSFAIALIRSSMCSASASVFGFLASTYLTIVFKASIGLVI
jgi:hypothetical protein